MNVRTKTLAAPTKSPHYRFVAFVEGVAASEVLGAAKDLSKGNQRCESFLLPVSADAGDNLQLTKILLKPVLRQRLVQ